MPSVGLCRTDMKDAHLAVGWRTGVIDGLSIVRRVSTWCKSTCFAFIYSGTDDSKKAFCSGR